MDDCDGWLKWALWGSRLGQARSWDGSPTEDFRPASPAQAVPTDVSVTGLLDSGLVHTPSLEDSPSDFLPHDASLGGSCADFLPHASPRKDSPVAFLAQRSSLKDSSKDFLAHGSGLDGSPTAFLVHSC